MKAGTRFSSTKKHVGVSLVTAYIIFRRHIVKRIIYILMLLCFIIIILLFFLKNNYNYFEIGNNKSITNNLQDYILGINSYEAISLITINSNKTTNTYEIKQIEQLNKKFIQEIIKPETFSR